MPSAPLPAPIGIKKKLEQAEIRRTNNLEKRAKKWEGEEKVLGHISKSNVSKPRALLAIPTMKQESADLAEEEEKLRNELWAARVLIDKGMLALLDLQELQRIIKDNRVNPDKKESLMRGVRTHIKILESCVGITEDVQEAGENKEGEEVGQPTKSFDANTLASVLKLPKGMQLVARTIETGILPHASAVTILPSALAELLSEKREESWAANKVNMEERLLNAFERGIVTISQPEIPGSVLKNIVRSVCAQHEGESTMKDAIATGRRRAEIMHTIMKRGGEVCEGDQEWESLEEGFIIMLKQQ